jgi:hypothetical protein
MVAKKRSGKVTGTARQTTLSREGFYEPFNIDAVPWHRTRGGEDGADEGLLPV